MQTPPTSLSDSLKVKTRVKAGGTSCQHNATLVRAPRPHLREHDSRGHQ